MSIKKTLGGDRLGAGNKMAVQLENFGRSSHDQGKIIRTDQAFGTLVPYYCNIGLNGTTFYMKAASIVRTLPTVGPIFGSAKQQIDFFHAPIRLYVAALHNNALGIGLKMQDVKLPRFKIRANPIDFTKPGFNQQQISQDSLLAYIGIRGLGNVDSNAGSAIRSFPALFQLMYWDIYKNYYSNKQEEVGFVIGRGDMLASTGFIINPQNSTEARIDPITMKPDKSVTLTTNWKIILPTSAPKEAFQFNVNGEWIVPALNGDWSTTRVNNGTAWEFRINGIVTFSIQAGLAFIRYNQENSSIQLLQFPLSNIDDMREAILAAPKTAPFVISDAPAGKKLPYSASYGNAETPENNNQGNASYFTQAGLGVKTYLSDRFNNWLSTEWIDGVEGINEITAVDVSDGKLTMDALILSKKVFNMLNRIAISGGSYNDWQEAVYGVTTVRMAESPMYAGGYSSEVVFDEVVSNSAAETSAGDQPLGSLAGRGATKYHKGGSDIKIKCNEPSLVMVIGSFTPRIDYSQGNKWWNRLETMNDFHKPNLDRIGFQELLTEEFAAFDTQVSPLGELTTHSVGKQPSWIEYMTEVNETYGSFAADGELEHMAFNRPYSADESGALEDATTYIDPTIFNPAFADTKLSAKNLWVQVAIDCTARRIMSAKQIPNL